jgi:hypothetical protein
MKRSAILALATALFAAVLAPWTALASPGVAGNWSGILDVGPAKLRLVFKIANIGPGGLSAKMDSPDQGARDIAVDKVTFDGGKLKIELTQIQGVYEGTIDKTGTNCVGEWRQGPGAFPLKLSRTESAAAPAPEEFNAADLAASREAARKFAGVWGGSLDAGAASLRLRVKIEKAANGAAAGTMDSLDQGANGIPLSGIVLKEGKLRFEVRGIGGSFLGNVSDDGSTITGQWKQGPATLPLELKRETVAK